ncbi:MAG: VOC family protein [Chthoniobacteraceae bacterium]
MKLEHFALNVSDPVAMAAWYVTHLGLRVVRHVPHPAQTHFLADEETSVLEIYCNPPDSVPHYRSMNPLQVHLAFTSLDPEADRTRLSAVGATYESEVRMEDGSHLIMMRDPWGLSFQLCQRAKALL